MKAARLLVPTIVLLFATPAVADEYYVVRGPDHHCTVSTTKPTVQTTVTQIGPLAFETREKAEARINTTSAEVCADTATTGTYVHKDRD
jgi:hypothetical protein